MALEAEALHRDAVGLQLLDQLVVGVALGVDAVDVVVVEVQLGVRVGLVGPAQGVGDVAGAERLEEDRLAVGAVLVEGLVDDVPVDDLALVVPCHRLDVVLEDGAQLVGGPGAIGEPGGELAVPDERVAADLLVVVLGEGHDLVAGGEVEDAGLGLGGVPLHGVAGGGLAELAAEELQVGGVGELGVVGGRAEVLVVRLRQFGERPGAGLGGRGGGGEAGGEADGRGEGDQMPGHGPGHGGLLG